MPPRTEGWLCGDSEPPSPLELKGSCAGGGGCLVTLAQVEPGWAQRTLGLLWEVSE